MPWKGQKDPYKVWLSEIILQQTRVLQGLAYYNKFVDAFPTIKMLADADDELVFKLWEGLGYYSRCKNLIISARHVAYVLGTFPKTYEDILKLKGVGPYTASAIASFAYGLPNAVVDGNVYRVLSRFFGESVPIDSTKGRKLFNDLAHKLLYQPDSSGYNQAIMDFGALVCTPQLAKCYTCPINQKCVAYNNGLVDKLPVKEKKLIKRKRWLHYFVFMNEDHVLVKKRNANDIWQNLYEFYLLETEKVKLWKPVELKNFLKETTGLHGAQVVHVSCEYKQQLTHQSLVGQFIKVQIDSVPASMSDYLVVPVEKLNELPFPRLITQYLEDAALR